MSNDQEPLDQQNLPEAEESEILTNEYGETRDSAVVVDEPDRTVLLTKDETIIIDKEDRIDIVPTNRPRKVYGGMWGQAEIVTISFAMIAVFLAALVYIFMVQPAKRELEENRAKRDRLETELIATRGKYGSITDTETHVAKLMASVDDFESRYLPVATSGKTSLYQRINGLITGYGLVNTTGPDYVPLETSDQTKDVQSEAERGRSKFRSLFPGVYVTMTLEGPYQNIRRFIREIETGTDFVVVSAIELEPTESDNQPKQSGVVAQNQINSGPNLAANPNIVQGFPQPNNVPFGGQSSTQAPERKKGKTHGEVVSLRLEMAAYFRRPNIVPTVVDPAGQ